MKLRLSYIFIVLLSLMAMSCIDDDRSRCLYSFDVKFSYTAHRQGVNRLRQEVEKLRLYLYDTQNDRLCGVKTVAVNELDSLNTISWSVKPGRYYMIVWGGTLGGQYRLSEHYEFAEGLMDVATDSRGYIQPIDEYLWHGTVYDIIVDGREHTPSRCSLRRLTTNLTVRATGLEVEDYARVTTTIRGSNGVYTFDAMPLKYSKPVTWLAVSSVETPKSNPTGVYRFNTLRASRGDDLRLTVTLSRDRNGRAVDGEEETLPPVVLYDGSLSELIALHPNLDIDLDHDFDLLIEITNPDRTDMSFNIYINNWLIVKCDGEL